MVGLELVMYVWQRFVAKNPGGHLSGTRELPTPVIRGTYT